MVDWNTTTDPWFRRTQTGSQPSQNNFTGPGNNNYGSGGWGSLQGWGMAIGGLGNLAQGYSAVQSLGLQREQNDIAKDSFNQNLAAQSATVADSVYTREYARNRMNGMSDEEAKTAARQSVNTMNLPTNINGKSLRW